MQTEEEPTGNDFATALGALINDHIDLPPLLILKVMGGVMEDFRALNTRLEINAAFEALAANLEKQGLRRLRQSQFQET